MHYAGGTIASAPIFFFFFFFPALVGCLSPAEHPFLMGSGAPDVTADEALAAFTRVYPGKRHTVEQAYVHNWAKDPWAFELRAQPFPLGTLKKFWPHILARGPDPFRRQPCRQPTVGDGRRHPLGQPRGPGHPRGLTPRGEGRTWAVGPRHRVARRRPADRPRPDTIEGGDAHPTTIDVARGGRTIREEGIRGIRMLSGRQLRGSGPTVWIPWPRQGN